MRITRPLRTALRLLFLSAFVPHSFAQQERQQFAPVPETVITSTDGNVPDDAIVLFDGSDLSQWRHINSGESPRWRIDSDGSLAIVPGTTSIETRLSFSDVQLHLEWRSNYCLRNRTAAESCPCACRTMAR